MSEFKSTVMPIFTHKDFSQEFEADDINMIISTRVGAWGRTGECRLTEDDPRVISHMIHALHLLALSLESKLGEVNLTTSVLCDERGVISTLEAENDVWRTFVDYTKP